MSPLPFSFGLLFEVLYRHTTESVADPGGRAF
jgi:hypothetical protein